MNNEKGIGGFKASEFANATPEKVLGEDVRIEELPDGIRLYLREKSIPLNIRKLVIKVYRLVDDGGLKNKKVWVGDVTNHIPEESEIAALFGGGSFFWIGKWLGADGTERGIVSEAVEIDEDFGRAAREQRLRKTGGGADSIPVPAAGPTLPAAMGGFGGDVVALMKLMDAAEEKTLARIERIAGIFAGQKQETPSEILAGAYRGASDMMANAVKINQDMARSVGKSQAKAMEAADRDDDDDDDDGAAETAATAGPSLPSWLAPFMPHLEKGLGKLLGGGVTGEVVKGMILESDEWQTIFGDKEKWGIAVAAMEKHFGSDKTRRALDILVPEEKPASKKTKSKGK